MKSSQFPSSFHLSRQSTFPSKVGKCSPLWNVSIEFEWMLGSHFLYPLSPLWGPPPFLREFVLQIKFNPCRVVWHSSSRSIIAFFHPILHILKTICLWPILPSQSFLTPLNHFTHFSIFFSAIAFVVQEVYSEEKYRRCDFSLWKKSYHLHSSEIPPT